MEFHQTTNSPRPASEQDNSHSPSRIGHATESMSLTEIVSAYEHAYRNEYKNPTAVRAYRLALQERGITASQISLINARIDSRAHQLVNSSIRLQSSMSKGVIDASQNAISRLIDKLH